MEYCLEPIGIIHSCFKEKFGIPRQAGLVSEARAVLELLPPYNQEEALNGLEQFSHIWVVFIFHATIMKKWKATVRPPRLGGNRRLGVFATRSNFRPNPLGLSVVELEKIEKTKGKINLYLKGVDFLDQTPVLDIKPYLAYADSVPQAECGFAPAPPSPRLDIEFSPEASAFCQEKENEIPHLRRFIVQMLQNDPRPAYYAAGIPNKNTFGIRIFDFNLKWKIEDGKIMVTEFETPVPDCRRQMN